MENHVFAEINNFLEVSNAWNTPFTIGMENIRKPNPGTPGLMTGRDGVCS